MRVVVPAAEGERLQEQLHALAETIEKEEKGDTWETVCVFIICFLYVLTGLSRSCSLSPRKSAESTNCCRKSVRERVGLRR